MKHDAHWLPMGFSPRCLSLMASCCMPLDHQLLVAYWALLESGTIASSKPLGLRTQVPMMPWVKEVPSTHGMAWPLKKKKPFPAIGGVC